MLWYNNVISILNNIFKYFYVIWIFLNGKMDIVNFNIGGILFEGMEFKDNY